jgi:Tol biopolymer transport system component
MNQPHLLAFAGLAALTVALAAPAPELISRRGVNQPAVATGNGPSSGGVFSGGNHHVVFTSQAANLVTNDSNGGQLDVFRRDLVAGTTQLLSVGSNGSSYGPSPSADGKRVVFISTGTSLVANDTNGVADVFVRDLDVNSTELVSGPLAAGATANGESGFALITADGTKVIFESQASNLTTGTDTNLGTDIIIRDLGLKTTLLVSHRNGSSDAGSHDSSSPVPSSNGGVIAFRSNATNLTAAITGNVTDLFVWRADTGGIQRIVLPGPPVAANQLPVRIFNPVLSGDGRYLAFRTAPVATPAGVGGLWWFDLVAGTNALASAPLNGESASRFDDGSGPVMTADGRTLAFEAPTGITASPGPRIHVWQADSGLHTLDELVLTLPAGGGEPATSFEPVLSPDGSKLAFLTTSAVPAAGVPDAGIYRLFVRTLITGATVALPDGGSPEPYDLALPEFSADGSMLVFQSEAALAAGTDANLEADVFVSDLATGKLTLVSAADTTVPAVTPDGYSNVAGNSVSADGRYVFFSSDAGDVVAGDSNGLRDVFRFDRQTQIAVRVSVSESGSAVPGGTTPFELSPDGRFALFQSFAPNFVAGDTNTLDDFFLRDITAGTTVLVSAKDQTDESGDGAAVAATMSADGQFVAFESGARNLVPGLFGTRNIFLRDVAGRRTLWLSKDDFTQGATGLQGNSSSPQISADGQKVVFLTTNSRNPWLYNRANGRLTRLATNQSVFQFSLSADGRMVAFGALTQAGGTTRAVTLVNLESGARTVIEESSGSINQDQVRLSDTANTLVFVSSLPLTGAADANQLRDVFHYDISSGLLQLISRGRDGYAGRGGESTAPRLSADGRFVVFRSQATNVATVDQNGFTDVFLHDTAAHVTRLVSANPNTGAAGNHLSTNPNLSADGRLVVFASAASDLVAGDLNQGTDVYAVANDIVSPTADWDADGLTDAWELAIFNDLGQTAAGDFDQDGQSNRDEFVTGTSPVDAESTFSVSAAYDPLGGFSLQWLSQFGTAYEVTSGSLLPGSFVPSGITVTGDGTVLSVPVPATADAGFFRVQAQR